MPKKQQTYTQALEKLEAIVARIEEGDVEVDDLTKNIAEATALIRFCKGKLRSAQDSVEKAIGEMEKESGGEGEK